MSLSNRSRGAGTRAAVPARRIPGDERTPGAMLLTSLALLAAIMAVSGPVAEAQQRKRPPLLSAPLTARDAREGVAQGAMRPLGDVLRQLRERAGGRQLDAQLVSASPNPVYEIQWLTEDGRRIDYVVDAHTGAILRQRGG